MLNEEQGKELIQLARKNMENFLQTGKRLRLNYHELPDYMKESAGIFVTLKGNMGELRGCIGIPYPDQSLVEGLLEASVSSMVDPRFLPVTGDELDSLIIELTVLSEPEKVEVGDMNEAKERIVIGQHGLIIRKGLNSGLLLPQVPLEHEMNLKEFLEAVCSKAGLNKGDWKEEDTEVYRFEGKVFRED